MRNYVKIAVKFVLIFENFYAKAHHNLFMKLTLILERFHWKLCQNIYEITYVFERLYAKLCQNLKEINIDF